MSSTPRDLRAQVAGGRFRRELLFRLATVELIVPSLRARGTALVALALQMLEAARAELGGAKRTLSEASEEGRCRASWTGNLRALRDLRERVPLLSSGEGGGGAMRPSFVGRGESPFAQ